MRSGSLACDPAPILQEGQIVHQLCDEVYPEAERVRLVCDQLDTHGPVAFHEAFALEEAWRLTPKVESVHTPVHGSLLNTVGCECSALVRQGLGHRRLGTIGALQREAEDCNAAGTTAEWQFATEDARVKLRRLYPSL